MTLNLRVSPIVKQEAEAVLKRLGVPMATAVDMYLRQIALTGGIPFSVTLPKNQVMSTMGDTVQDESEANTED